MMFTTADFFVDFVSNRNIEAKVIRGNIPVSNGVIHVLDDVIYFDYQSVIEELDTRPELRLETLTITPKGRSINCCKYFVLNSVNNCMTGML